MGVNAPASASPSACRIAGAALAAPDGVAQAAAAFHRDGCVVLEQVLAPAELEALREQTAGLIAEGRRSGRGDIDYFFTAAGALHRIQYIFPKAPSLLTLLTHPQLLAAVGGLLGTDFLCTGEALVFKAPGDGAEVPLHRDLDSTGPVMPLKHVAFNIDVYLDDATPANGCLEVVPGSHAIEIEGREIAAHGFSWPGLVPVPVRAGDVIIHHLRLLHGSRHSRHPSLRRTLYYEFHRRADVLAHGVRPGTRITPAWAANRVRILEHAQRLRRATPWGADERSAPFLLPPDVPPGEVDLRPRLGLNKYA